MPNPDYNKAFDAAIQAAVQGARINAVSGDPQLAPVMFLITYGGTIQLVEWGADEQPYNSIGYIRNELVKPAKAVGIVFVCETSLGFERNGESGMMDGVLVYGYLRRPEPRATMLTFALSSDRKMSGVAMRVPERLVKWAKEVFKD